MEKIVIKVVILFLITVIYSFLFIQPLFASTLSNVSDRISTSRPSASAPLFTDQAANDTQVEIYSNGSIFLASDSATMRADTGETLNSGIFVASASGQKIPDIEPSDLSGLALWYDANDSDYLKSESNCTGTVTNGGTVGCWQDKSGNGKNATQATTGNRPTYETNQINSKPILRFVQDTNWQGFTFTSTSVRTAIFVFNHPTGSSPYLSADYETVIFGDGSNYPFHGNTGTGLIGCSWASSSLCNGSGYSNGTLTAITSLTKTTSFRVLTLVLTGNVNVSNIALGHSSSRAMSGDVAEIVVYNRALNNTERQAIEKYLSDKYAVSVSSNSSYSTRTLYFTSPISNSHHAGDPVTVPITAVHSVSFTSTNPVPSSGKIVLTFPGLGDSSASPSASTFAFNGLSPPNVVANGASCTFTVSAPTITCTLGSSLAAGTAVSILVGCSAQSGGNCTTPVPSLINPTKTAAGGSADIWKLSIQTQDSGGVVIDNSTVAIGTVESIQVQGKVDPTLTVTIAGLTSGDNNNTIAGGTCGSESSVNVGVNATATFINFGALGTGILSRSAQSITVTTNAANGYAIAATSSGRLVNPETGYWITDANGGNGLTANDTPAPAVMVSGTAAFGISPCGQRVSSSSPNWGSNPNTASFTGTPARFSNPWNSGTNSYYATLASYSGGPISADVTIIRYGATISQTTPAGIYRNLFTYIVTPTF